MRFLLLLLTLATLPLHAQTVIDGTAKDCGGNAIARVIVKALDGERMVSFATSKADGSFRLIANSKADSLTVTAEHIAYQKKSLRIVNQAQTLALALEESATQLREVVVEAPAVVLKGDTLRFNLAQFLGKGDVSLEDALKKLPGITVNEQGTIQYMGKNISNFYVEGLEMLGGNYTLATRNLSAENVAGVEVLNNHKKALMDKDKLSDDVALNVRLKDKAMLRPTGTSEAAIGHSRERVLYTLGATGMLFTKQFQTIVGAKTGNIDDFAVNQTTDLIRSQLGLSSSKALAAQAVGELSGGAPPIRDSRYLNVNDRLLTANAIAKLGEHKTLRVNTSYAYHKQENEASSEGSYFLGEGSRLTLNRQTDAMLRTHSPKLETEYTLNAEKRYVNNSLALSARFAQSELPTVENGTAIAQQQKTDWFSLNDNLSLRAKSGRREWSSNTAINFTKAPTLRLDMTSSRAEYNATQTAASQTIRIYQRFGTAYSVGGSQVSLPLVLDFQRSSLETFLSKPEKEAGNDLSGNTLKMELAPRYEFTTRDKRLQWHATLNLHGVLMSGENSDGQTLRFNRLFADPSVYLKYIASAKSQWVLSTAFFHNHGDLLTLLTQPVAHNYRSESVKSGILARNAAFTARGSYDYKHPITLWFASLSTNYSTVQQNLLASSYITDSASSSTLLSGHNRTQTASASFNLSKGVKSINSKFTLNGGWSWSKQRIVQQDLPINYYGTNVYTSFSANLRPVKQMEANFSGQWDQTTTRYAGVHNTFRNLSGVARLSVFPTGRLELSATADHQRRQLTDGSYKSLTLFDAFAALRIKAFRLKLSANNLLNQRTYAYTLHSALDTYSYAYNLRGRELVFSIIYQR